MKFLVTSFMLFFCCLSFSQNDDQKRDSISSKTVTSEKKQISSGIKKFHEYINHNFITPNVLDFPGGKVIVKFTINIEGSVEDIKILKDIGYGCGEQIKKILENCKKWSPAIKNGVPVASTFTLPIIIKGNSNY